MNLFRKIKYAACHLYAYTTTPVLTAFISNPVLAAGFQRGNTVMQKVAIGLHGMAAITITVAVVWVGYKTLWNGESLRSCGYIIIGGILIGGGSEIGALLIGSEIGKPY